MTPLLFLALSLAGGLGAVARFALDGAIKARTSGSFPVGTAMINLSGSLVLGFITGAAAAHALPESAHDVVGIGFLGGYTTFSTASVETVRILQERRTVAGAFNGVGILVGAVVLAGLGLWLGGLF